MPEFTQLDSVKSMMRYLPANGTAGLARCADRTLSRSPCPPARMMAATFRTAMAFQVYCAAARTPRRKITAPRARPRAHARTAATDPEGTFATTPVDRG